MSKETLEIFAELMMKDKRDLVCTLMERTAENIDLENQLEEKQKIIDEAKEFLIKWGKQPDADMYYCINEYKEYTELLQILERGKND